MDPTNQEGQNPDNVGTGRQAIFTPQPPEPATPENNPGTPNAQPTPSVNLSHPYFSNHPTQTQSVETGDIILNNGPAKKQHNKRPFIIGGVILVVFLLVCILILAIVSANSGTNNASKSNDAETKFNQFATYLLYGTASDTLTGEYESDKSYEIDLQLESDTFDNDYWAKSSELLDDAISLAENDDNITRYLTRSLKVYRQYFDFIRLYRQSGEFRDEDLLTTFLNSGANSADLSVDRFYNSFNDLDFELADDYASKRRQQYGDTVMLYSIYADLGCIHDGVISETSCTGVATANAQEDFLSLYSSINKSMIEANKDITSATTYLKSRCWELSAWLQNPVDERDGGDGDEN